MMKRKIQVATTAIGTVVTPVFFYHYFHAFWPLSVVISSLVAIAVAINISN